MGSECRSNGESLITSTEYKSVMALTASGAGSSVPLPDTPHVKEQLAVIPPPSTPPPVLWEEGEKQERMNSTTLDRGIAY